MRRSFGFASILVMWLVGLPALAEERAALAEERAAKLDLLLREIVEGMPSGDKQEVRVFTATSSRATRPRSSIGFR